MMKLRKASKITIKAIKSTFVSGFCILIFMTKRTNPVMNSKDHEKTVIWRLTLLLRRRLALEVSDNSAWIVSLLSDL